MANTHDSEADFTAFAAELVTGASLVSLDTTTWLYAYSRYKEFWGLSTKFPSTDADTLLKWADEVDLPRHGPEIHPKRNFDVEHIHIGPVDHIPVN